MYKAIESLYIAIKENLLSTRRAKLWNRLLRAAVEAPSSELFRTRLDKALSNVGWPRAPLRAEAGPETP